MLKGCKFSDNKVSYKRRAHTHVWTSKPEICGISEIPFFIMLLMFIVVHFMMLFSEKVEKGLNFNIFLRLCENTHELEMYTT